MTRSETALRNSQPIGVVLAGGPGIRVGGAKPTLALRGRALLLYPVAAMKLVFSEVAVIAKAQTVLPPTDGAMIWIEPELPINPLLGVCEALRLAGGRPVTVCPTDLPFVTPETLSALCAPSIEGAPAVIASCRGVARPLLGCYRPATVPLLELFDIDTPDDLLQASAMLSVSSPRRAVRSG